MLILTDGVKPNVFLSGRNLPIVHVMPYSDVSTYHILWSDVVLIEAGAIGQALAPMAERDEANAEARRAVAGDESEDRRRRRRRRPPRPRRRRRRRPLRRPREEGAGQGREEVGGRRLEAAHPKKKGK